MSDFIHSATFKNIPLNSPIMIFTQMDSTPVLVKSFTFLAVGQRSENEIKSGETGTLCITLAVGEGRASLVHDARFSHVDEKGRLTFFIDADQMTVCM